MLGKESIVIPEDLWRLKNRLHTGLVGLSCIYYLCCCFVGVCLCACACAFHEAFTLEVTVTADHFTVLYFTGLVFIS